PVLFFCAWSSHSFSSPPPSCHFHLSSFLLFFSHLVFPCRCSHALTTSSEKPQRQPSQPHTHTHTHTPTRTHTHTHRPTHTHTPTHKHTLIQYTPHILYDP